MSTAYAMIPTWVLYADISAQSVRLYACLRDYAGARNIAWPSRATLAEKMQCSRATLDRALRELVSIGAVAIKSRWRSIQGETSNTRDTEHNERTSSLYEVRFDNPAEVSSPVTQPPLADDATVSSPVQQELEPSDPKPKERRDEREQAQDHPSRPRRRPLPEDFQFDQDALVAQFDLPAVLVAEELDALRDHAKIEGMRSADWDASARWWIRRAQRYRAKAEDRSPNVSNLYGQGTLFEPGSGDRRRAWLTERVAEREAQEAAAASSVPSCDESPEAIRRRILRSLETA